MAKVAPEDVADYFLFISEGGVTHVKLQRLVYFAQAWMLANTGEALFDEDFEAWNHGPTLPSLWKIYQKYGRVWETIPAKKKPFLTIKVEEFLNGLWENYSRMPDDEIEEAAMDEAWKAVREKVEAEGGGDETMEKEEIKKAYLEYL